VSPMRFPIFLSRGMYHKAAGKASNISESPLVITDCLAPGPRLWSFEVIISNHKIIPHNVMSIPVPVKLPILGMLDQVEASKGLPGVQCVAWRQVHGHKRRLRAIYLLFIPTRGILSDFNGSF
jgi:hypothetical protein